MLDTTKLKAALQKDLDSLSKAREELRLQANLAKAEARAELDRLGSSWQRVQTEIKRVGEHSKQPVREIETVARTVLDELKRGYGRVKRQLKDAKDAKDARR